MRQGPGIALLAVVMLFASQADAQDGSSIPQATLARVQRTQTLRCGAAIRPGLAFPAADQSWHGLLVDLCHSVAAAVIGPDATVEFNGYAPGSSFERARGADDVSFLTGSEVFARNLFDTLQPGPAVFLQSSNVMVWETSAIRHLAELGNGRPEAAVCAEPGTSAERNLNTYAAAHSLTLQYSGWQELEEMSDAFNVGRCPVMAGELTALAALRLSSQAEGHPARILPEPLGVTPVMAMTARADGAWAAAIDWVLLAFLSDGKLPAAGVQLGLDPAWQARMAGARGSYAAIFERNLGQDSVLALPPGLNASWSSGGLIAPASVE